MARKEGVFSFTVYCSEDYLEKVKTAATGKKKKVSTFVTDILDRYFGGELATAMPITANDTVFLEGLRSLSDRVSSIENILSTVSNSIGTVSTNSIDTVLDTSEATAPEKKLVKLSQHQKDRAMQEVKKSA